MPRRELSVTFAISRSSSKLTEMVDGTNLQLECNSPLPIGAVSGVHQRYHLNFRHSIEKRRKTHMNALP